MPPPQQRRADTNISTHYALPNMAIMEPRAQDPHRQSGADPFGRSSLSQGSSGPQDSTRPNGSVDIIPNWLTSAVYSANSTDNRRQSGPLPWSNGSQDHGATSVSQAIHTRHLPPLPPPVSHGQSRIDTQSHDSRPPASFNNVDYGAPVSSRQLTNGGLQQLTPPSSAASPTQVVDRGPSSMPIICHLANLQVLKDHDHGCTGKDYRKFVSHFFGRNKACTKKIPHEAWLTACRCCYQRAVYHGKKDLNLSKLQEQFLNDQLDKINDSAVSINWEIKWTTQLASRIRDYTKRITVNNGLPPSQQKSAAEIMEAVIPRCKITEPGKWEEARKEVECAILFPCITGPKGFGDVKQIVADVANTIGRSPDFIEFPRFEMLPHDLVPKNPPMPLGGVVPPVSGIPTQGSLAIQAARASQGERPRQGRAGAQQRSVRHSSSGASRQPHNTHSYDTRRRQSFLMRDVPDAIPRSNYATMQQPQHHQPAMVYHTVDTGRGSFNTMPQQQQHPRQPLYHATPYSGSADRMPPYSEAYPHPSTYAATAPAALDQQAAVHERPHSNYQRS
jgi:hypothetical protein